MRITDKEREKSMGKDSPEYNLGTTRGGHISSRGLAV